MLKEGERPPVDKNYNNKSKSNHNQINDQYEEEQEQPEWADFTSEQIKVGDKNQNKWGLTMSQDRDSILGVKKVQDDRGIQSSTNEGQTSNTEQQQQLEVSMGQISTGQINSPNDPSSIVKVQPEIQSRPKDLSSIPQQESKLGVTIESNSNSSLQNVQVQQKYVDNTLMQKKKIDQKLDGVFQAPKIPQNSYSQYQNQMQYAYQQAIPKQFNNNINVYYNHQNNPYYATNPSTTIQQQPSAAMNPSSLMTPHLQQQNYYMNQQAMMYSAQQQQQQQKQQQQQQQAYQYNHYMNYNTNSNNMQWIGLQQQQQQQMQYQQQKAQNNPFACPSMNLLQTARVWEYVDPQGNKQGKFTGIQMYDWLHAGYFTLDLQISCDGLTYMKLGQYLGQKTFSYQSQIQQQSGGGSAYYYPIN